MNVKRCSKCGKSLPLSEFYRNAATKDGLTNYCRKCTREANKRWREKNPEYGKQYYQEHRNHLLSLQRASKQRKKAKAKRVYRMTNDEIDQLLASWREEK